MQKQVKILVTNGTITQQLKQKKTGALIANSLQKIILVSLASILGGIPVLILIRLNELWSWKEEIVLQSDQREKTVAVL